MDKVIIIKTSDDGQLFAQPLDAQQVAKKRGMSFDAETGDPIFQRSQDEAIDRIALELSEGKPYFIGQFSKIPDRLLYSAWRYDDSGKTPKVTVDMDVARNLCKAILTNIARGILNHNLNDPLSDDPNASKKRAAVKSLYNATTFLEAATPEELLKHHSAAIQALHNAANGVF